MGKYVWVGFVVTKRSSMFSTREPGNRKPPSPAPNQRQNWRKKSSNLPQHCPSPDLARPSDRCDFVPNREEHPLIQILGLRPSDPAKALRVAGTALKRAPLLIQIFNHCYIPCNPCLAGNPIFYVDENRIFCCGLDLSDFFERKPLFWKSETDPYILKKQRSDLFRVSLHVGMVLGIGDVVAHRAVDALMGPPCVTIRNEAAAASATLAVPARPAAAPILETMASTSSISGSDACSNHFKAFQDCINEFVSDNSHVSNGLLLRRHAQPQQDSRISSIAKMSLNSTYSAILLIG
ncbi:hypothetical protein C1H46_034822 [Malus baccata]|uniref:Uncharacterized protein n=1 Tax=Malus baccata TaxID=106549 RepID=A0A540KZK2_MALBA|nr:hypothetical protein C1H46_034822 [Malus baccata]